MTEGTFVLEPGRLSLAALRRIERDDVAIVLAPECRDLVERARDLVNAIVEAGTPTYGINTGLGTLSSRSIAPEDLEEMQSRLLLSNAAGTGALLPDSVVRRLMLLKINTLARGRSGVRPELIDALVSLYNAGVTPCIPSKGSVGASGDLAPLAHLGVALLGEGQVRVGGATLAAADGPYPECVAPPARSSVTDPRPIYGASREGPSAPRPSPMASVWPQGRTQRMGKLVPFSRKPHSHLSRWPLTPSSVTG